MKKMIFFLSVLLLSHQSQAFLSHGYNIEQLSSKANLIFMGQVTRVDQSPTTGNDLPYIEVHFRVFESMKGNVPSTYSFRQFAPKTGKQFQLLGMDKKAYVVGQKLVMFLGTPGPNTGFRAPADFQLFQVQTKSDRQSDIDQSIIMNKQLGDKIGATLFQNLQKPNTLRMVDQMQKVSKTSQGIAFKDFRNLIQASIE